VDTRVEKRVSLYVFASFSFSLAPFSLSLCPILSFFLFAGRLARTASGGPSGFETQAARGEHISQEQRQY